MTEGQVAELLSATVRTLRHYDEIGLVVPIGGASGGYWMYSAADIIRLQQVVVHHRVGFAQAGLPQMMGA